MTRLLTVKELQQLLGVSRDTIHRWRKDHGLPFMKYGPNNAAVRFDIEQVRKWQLEQLEQQK